MTSSSSRSVVARSARRSSDSRRICRAARCDASLSSVSPSCPSPPCSSFRARSSTVLWEGSSVNGPGVLSEQQPLEVAGTLLLRRRAELVLHRLTVDGSLDIPKDSERGGFGGPLGDT